MQKLVESAHPDREIPKIMRDCPNLPRVLEPVYQGFFEVDRTEWGSLEFKSMLAVLDEYGVMDKAERAEWRSIWRSLSIAENEEREKQSEKKGKKDKKDKKPDGTDRDESYLNG